MGDLRFRAALTALAVIAMLTSCAPTDAPTAEPEPPVPSATPTADAGPVSAFDIPCADVKDVLDAVSGVSELAQGEAQKTWIWPGTEAVRQAGGLSCSWLGDVGRAEVSALPAAAAEFREARAAAANSGAATGVPEWMPHLDSAVGDEGIQTCSVYGDGTAGCDWSVLAGDAWIVVSLSSLPLGLIEPGDGPDGRGRMPHPEPGGAVEVAVDAAVAAIAGAPRLPAPASVVPDMAACLERLAPSRVAPVLGVDPSAITTAPGRTGAQVAEWVPSTAGYALPTYAADRMGWARCEARTEATSAELTIAPGAASAIDPQTTAGAGEVEHGSGEDGEVYRYVRFVGDDAIALVVSNGFGTLPADVETLIPGLLD